MNLVFDPGATPDPNGKKLMIFCYHSQALDRQKTAAVSGREDARRARLQPMNLSRADGLADIVDNALDYRQVVALGHDANNGLRARWADHQAPFGAELSRADRIALATEAFSSGATPLKRTFFRICGSGSKAWQTSLTGLPRRLTTAMT